MKIKSRARILLIDDRPAVSVDLPTVLRSADFLVDVAPTGSRAVTSVQEAPPDLVILNVESPELHGFEVTGDLRAKGVTAPVVFLAPQDGQRDKVAGVAIGGDAYLDRRRTSAQVVAGALRVLHRAGLEVGEVDPLCWARDEASGEMRRHPGAVLRGHAALCDTARRLWNSGPSENARHRARRGRGVSVLNP